MSTDRRWPSRRTLLLGLAGGLGVGAAGGATVAFDPFGEAPPADPTTPAGLVAPSSGAVRRREQQRQGAGTGRTIRATMTAEPGEVDLGGRLVETWAYNGELPGPTLRCTAGDRLSIELVNRLPDPTTIHWHGLRIRNDMDGVPNLTQAAVPSGGRTRYSFIAPDPGTYWFHPHVGLQRERGLSGALIVDDPYDPGDYDVEFTVLVDDWIDGTGTSPEEVLGVLQDGGMGTRYRSSVEAGKIQDRSSSWRYHVPPRIANPPKGMEPDNVPSRLAGDVEFPYYLLDGRLPTAPRTFRAKPGQRARIRLINAAGATTFRVALGGHTLTVTHTDGFPVQPVETDTLQIASGERYDLLVTLGDGAFPLVAVAEGKGAQALGVVRTASGRPPGADVQPDELAGRLLALRDLRAPAEIRLADRSPDRRDVPYLTGDMSTYGWRINAETYDPDRPFHGITPMPVREGQTVRLALVNQTPMYHPMHLHGHTFQVRAIGTNTKAARSLTTGTRKDTLMVPPGQRITIDLTADNPGQWLLHCHNAYHLAAGMATMLSYQQPGSR